MPRGTLILDGLWHCLCPSFSLDTLAHSAPPIIRKTRRPRVPFVSSTSAPAWRRLSSLTANPQKHDAEGDHKQDAIDNNTPRPQRRASRYSHQHNTRAPRPSRVPDTLKRKPTARLETRLQEIVATRPTVVSAVQILRALIRDRHVRPDTRHYKALILANTDAERGSPENVRELLSEMEANRITADSGTLHAALQVRVISIPSFPEGNANATEMLTANLMARSLRFIRTMYCDRKSYIRYEIDG